MVIRIWWRLRLLGWALGSRAATPDLLRAETTHQRSLSLILWSCCVLMASAFDNGIRRSAASVLLKYSIAAASEHSGVYVASNILRDEPADSTSRWSGASQIPHVKQWVTLRLDKLAILSLVLLLSMIRPVLTGLQRALPLGR